MRFLFFVFFEFTSVQIPVAYKLLFFYIIDNKRLDEWVTEERMDLSHSSIDSPVSTRAASKHPAKNATMYENNAILYI